MGLILIGATLQTSAFTLAHLISGRIITGLGTGMDSSTVPMYQSELARKEWRGRIVSWEIWFIGVGIVTACQYETVHVHTHNATLTIEKIGLIMASHTLRAMSPGGLRSVSS